MFLHHDFLVTPSPRTFSQLFHTPTTKIHTSKGWLNVSAEIQNKSISFSETIVKHQSVFVQSKRRLKDAKNSSNWEFGWT